MLPYDVVEANTEKWYNNNDNVGGEPSKSAFSLLLL